jgi:signal transduction histidine kinase
MGLGLSFVVVILEHHRAALTIESEPMRGTTFRVQFFTAPHGEQAHKAQPVGVPQE